MNSDVRTLAATLADADSPERAAAAERLAQLGPDARDAAVALVRSSADPDEAVCQQAVAALEELGPPALSDLDRLAVLSDDASADVAYWAVTLLGRLGPDAANATAVLAAVLLESPHKAVRQRAAWALGKTGPPAAAALDALGQAAKSDDTRLARLASRAVGRIQG